MPKNIFVVGLDDINLQKLKGIKNADNYNFVQLLDLSEIQKTEKYPLSQWISRAEKQLNNFDGSVDAIIGFWDFPVSPMVPILANWQGANAPTLESVIKCEHKYWSRLEQAKVIPENIPDFDVINPYDDDPGKNLKLGYPFWLKPVKAFASQLGFHVKNKEDFERAIKKIRQGISKFAEPFNHFLSYIELPDEIARVNGRYCIAESIIGGEQCTISGYSYNGKVDIYGVVDSIRYPEVSSFFKYQYPSKLPEDVKNRMAEISRKVIKRLGFDNSPFNIEFFYDKDNDHLWLLEVNTRISQSHSDLYEKVDGRSNHQALVQIALGEQPQMPDKKGSYNIAAKLQYREFDDGLIEKVPGDKEFNKLKEEQPDTIVVPMVEEGQKLSDLANQDSYSYRLAVIYMGADNEEELEKKYERCLEILDYRIKR